MELDIFSYQSNLHLFVRMAEGIQMLQKTLGTEIADRIVRNGDELFDDQELDIISPHQPKKMLGMWI